MCELCFPNCMLEFQEDKHTHSRSITFSRLIKLTRWNHKERKGDREHDTISTSDLSTAFHELREGELSMNSGRTQMTQLIIKYRESSDE